MKFSRKHIQNVMLKALKQGITPRKLALTCALGVVLGLFPIFGTTTILCFAAAAIFRLNIPVIQLVNYLIAPLQLILIAPLIKIGFQVLGLRPFPYTTDELISLFRNDFWHVIQETGFALAIGVGVWAVLSIPLFFILFFIAFYVFQKWKPDHRELKSQ